MRGTEREGNINVPDDSSATSPLAGRSVCFSSPSEIVLRHDSQLLMKGGAIMAGVNESGKETTETTVILTLVFLLNAGRWSCMHTS